MRRLFRLFGRRAVDRELDDELAFHIEMRALELVRQGWTREAALAEVRRRFGDLDDARRVLLASDTRTERRRMRTLSLAELSQDIRYALRTLRRTPGFTLVAAATLAIGIGANTAIFSVVRGILLRPLPFADPDRVVTVLSDYRGSRFPYVSPANAADWQARARSFTSFAVIESLSEVLTGEADPEELPGAAVGADFFAVLGARPVAGRLSFTSEEAAWRGPRVVILSEALWRTRFGADPDITGRLVTLDDQRYAVIGVAPAESTWPTGAMLWHPFMYDPAQLADSRGAVYLGVVARLAPGVTVDAAHAEMQEIARQLEREFPDANDDLSAAVVPLHTWIVGSLDRPLLILLGGVGFVLLIACANVANLLLVRGAGRRSEIAVRAALGAGRGRLVRQLATESMLLSLTGAGLGIVVALVGTRFLVRNAPATIPRLDAVHVDGMVLAFALAVALVTGLVFGLLPARATARVDLARTLREGGRTVGRGVGAHRTRRLLVVAEVALAVMLLAGAGLLIRSFDRMLRVDPGIRPAGVTSFALSLPSARYPTGDRQTALVHQLLERLRAAPGVDGAGASLALPLTGFNFNFSFAIAGRPPTAPAEQPSAEVRVATADWFRTMGVRIVRGRGFSEADQPGAPRALVLNETAARRFFRDEDPIGHRVHFGWRGETENLSGEIVGMIGDVKQGSPDSPTLPEFWAAYEQWPVSSIRVVVRSARSHEAIAADARRIVTELDPALAVSEVKPLDAVLADSVAQPRFYLLLLTLFAAAALVLSAIGIYGVAAHLVGQRVREIGIRMALGASRERVMRMVLREGAMLGSIGLLLGMAGALALTRVMEALLFGVEPSDPLTYGFAAVTLGLAVLVACWAPARRAARVNPALTMRVE